MPLPPTFQMVKNNIVNKLRLSLAKLNLSYVEVIVEVVVKFREKVVVNARVQLLFRRVGGRIKQN